MRRVTLVAAAVLVAATVTAPASSSRAPRSERRVEARYQTPSIAAHPVVAVCQQDGAVSGNRGCVTFPTVAGERFVHVEIADASGLPVQGFIALEHELQPDWRPFCGATTEPVPIAGTVVVIVYPYSPPGLPPCLGAATFGSVTAVFSNRR